MDGYTQSTLKGGDDQESASRMTEEADPVDAPPRDAEEGWRVESVNIRKAENGGFIASCSQRRDRSPSKGEASSYEDTYRSKDYAFSSFDELASYLGTELSGEAAGMSSGSPAMASSVPGPVR